MDALIRLDLLNPLLDGLMDASRPVRRAALRALTRLNLDPEAGEAVKEFIQPWLDAGDSASDFGQLVVDGIPYWEILEASSYLPDQGVRSQIRGYLDKLPNAQRDRLAGLLIRASDATLIQQIWFGLDPDHPQDWGQIAPLLYRIPPPGESGLARLSAAASNTAANAQDVELKFWLSLALASAGDIEPLKTLFETAGDQSPVDLSLPWQFFGALNTRLHPRPPLSMETYAFLDGWSSAHPGTASAELADLLLNSARASETIEPAHEENDPQTSLLLEGLYEAYLAVYKGDAFYGGLNAERISWTVGHAGMEPVLRAIAPRLYDPLPDRRLAAARLIEQANCMQFLPLMPGVAAGRLSYQQYPPDVWPIPVETGQKGAIDVSIPVTGGGGEISGGAMGGAFDDQLAFGVGVDLEPAVPPVINLGWVSQAEPNKGIPKEIPLKPEQDYYFWLDVDLPSQFSTATTQVGLHKDLQPGALLSVTVVGYRDSLQIDPQASVGKLQVLEGGFARVADNGQPLGEQAPKTSRSAVTLYFPVKTPAKPGEHRLRCNIYYENILLQSWMVNALVALEPQPTTDGAPALRSDLDFHLTTPLNLNEKAGHAPHRLSLQLNPNHDGSHSFHLKGSQDDRDFKEDDVRFGEGEMQGLITQARQVLQIANWGKPEDWQEGWKFRYQDRKIDWQRFAGDLRELARWGYEIYHTVCDRFAGGFEAVSKFEELMRASGYVQIAMKASPTYILPAALIYDYPLDTSAAKYKLCPDFFQAVTQGRDLETEPCFNGQCPSNTGPGADPVLTTLCPGGFWGFRHYLGLPISLAEEEGDDAPVNIFYSGKPRFMMGEWSDFTLVKKHKDMLDDLPIQFSSQSDRSAILSSFKTQSSELIYFYCHGGLVRGRPYLVVGSQSVPGEIGASNFKAFRIRWEKEHQPLVFLNGCHTSAVEPLAAITLLRGFVLEAQAAGLIGTEVTIYEELATDFAEEFYKRFLSSQTVGQALRGARLKILAQGNPLGLVYTPFVRADLHLVEKTDGGGMGFPQAAEASATGVDLPGGAMGGAFDVVIPGVDIPGGAMGSGAPAGGKFDIEIPGIT